jgi:hypothetical protein
MATAPLPPAAWYATANDARSETYWDGAQWTTAVRPVAPIPVRGRAPRVSRERAVAALVLTAIVLIGAAIVNGQSGSENAPPCPTVSVAAGDWAGSIQKGIDMAQSGCR